ncbi:MAG TPA: class I SAM-dependent methyltransferase [Byssovorax sp.]|jgi:tRNA (cmo5U34)-methyltransferase
MSDNATPHKAAEYAAEVKRTIPFHDEMIDEAIGVSVAAVGVPRRWLDTGAGPGELVRRASHALPGTEFWVADPAEAMLAAAREALPSLDAARFLESTSAALPDAEPFDVITAVQCHHYGDAAERFASVRRCRELLDDAGVLVVFENVRAETDAGHALQRKRWGAWQASHGRDAGVVAKHLAREGTAFFPIRVSDHLEVLRAAGFVGAEVVFRAYAQAGFVAWKAGFKGR